MDFFICTFVFAFLCENKLIGNAIFPAPMATNWYRTANNYVNLSFCRPTTVLYLLNIRVKNIFLVLIKLQMWKKFISSQIFRRCVYRCKLRKKMRSMMFALNIWRRLGFPFEMALLVQISYSFNHHLDDFIPNARKSMANDQNQLTLLCAHFEPKEKKLSEHFPWWRQTMPSFMCLVQITYPLLSFALEFAASSILLFVKPY